MGQHKQLFERNSTLKAKRRDIAGKLKVEEEMVLLKPMHKRQEGKARVFKNKRKRIEQEFSEAREEQSKKETSCTSTDKDRPVGFRWYTHGGDWNYYE
jgi:hypothetical protein